ncbi:MAG: hypothetical protein WC716_02195 [Chitinophagaceae bacterium]|jgi:hypothetical protein
MKRFLILSLGLCSFGATVLWAQAKKAKPANKKVVAKAKYPYKAAPVFLGNSNLRGGLLAKAKFDSLMDQGLTAIDSAGTPGKVIEFRIYYKERNLYEDSMGNFYTDVEMLTDMSKSNKLNSYVALQNRTKKGDTAIFDDIMVLLPDSIFVRGTSMTFIIGK